jgi:hypothetical protein
MNNYNQQFEKLSFWQLLAKISVEIPIIQRDYAQGRENQQEIRNKFLKALCDALTDEPVELDFVYGSEENDTLQPLDGQQRLTTLFLLHWYIATKEKKIDEFQKHLEIRDEKEEVVRRKFSYETRTSAREFCYELTANRIDFDNLLIADTDSNGQSKNNGLSKTIRNSAWSVASWEKDPTILAMLIMLDAIHLKFNDTSGLWQKLIDEQNPPITFLYVKLENFGLSDDLYIKMNARGKQLTAFENFKSQFEKHIEINKFENDIANTEEQFAHKIDTVWTDLFWQYNEKQDDNSYSIDTKLINFIAGIAINNYAQEYSSSSQKKEIENRIQILANESHKVTPEDFQTKEAFRYLMGCFDKYSEKQDNVYKKSKLKPDFDLWNYCNSTIFEDFIQYSAPQYKPRVLFYAQTIYLLNNNFDENSFSDWLRVVRNIIENSSIEHPNDFISAVNLVQELSSGCSDIYAYLANNKVSAGHAKEQVKEEIEKAKIIVENQDNKQVIQKTEDTNFCKGKIDFALYCIDYDIENNPVVSIFDKDKLEKIHNVLEQYLLGEDVTNDFRRAFFTIQNNDFYDYWTSSWLYAVDEPKRKIIENINDLKNNFVFRGKNNCNISNHNLAYFKELISQLSEKDIDTLISDYISTPKFIDLPNWKQRIIQEKGLLEHSKKHYIAIKRDNSCCWLIPYSKVGTDENGKKQLKKIE